MGDLALPRRPLRRVAAGGEGAYRRLAALAGFVLRHATREEWGDAAALPRTGGVLVVANHVSYLDPIAMGRYLVWNGRWPRFLGKAELWSMPLIGWLARACGQIPVQRGTARAVDALAAARAALDAGECVAIYPEGGRTRDPELWPQTHRTGAARLALATGHPVVPIALWGTQDVMPGRRLTWPRVLPPRRVRMAMGDPIALGDLAGRADDPAAVAEAGRRIMAAITTLLEGLLGEAAPTAVWDPRRGERVPRRGEPGNPGA